MEQVVKDVMRGLEHIAADSKLSQEFVREMTVAEHRTHQQRIAKLLVAVFKAHAENGNRGVYDGRNDATIAFAMKMEALGIFKDARFPCI